MKWRLKFVTVWFSLLFKEIPILFLVSIFQSKTTHSRNKNVTIFFWRVTICKSESPSCFFGDSDMSQRRHKRHKSINAILLYWDVGSYTVVPRYVWLVRLKFIWQRWLYRVEKLSFLAIKQVKHGLPNFLIAWSTINFSYSICY